MAAAVAEKPTRAGPRKVSQVAQLSDRLARATSAIVTDYRGLTVKQLEELRARLRNDGIEYHVVKNTLARRAATEAGVGQFSSVLVGPVGLALGYGDLSAPARILNEYFRVNRRLPIVAGMVEKRVLDAEAVRAVADLPSREVLLSQLAGTLQSPLTTLAGALTSILSNFAATLDAYREKLEADA
jgi:large subunit ribosomal protein L10